MEQARKRVTDLLNSIIEEAELEHLKFGGVAVPKDLKNLLPMVSLFNGYNKSLLITMADTEITASLIATESMTTEEVMELASLMQLLEHRMAKFFEWWKGQQDD